MCLHLLSNTRFPSLLLLLLLPSSAQGLSAPPLPQQLSFGDVLVASSAENILTTTTPQTTTTSKSSSQDLFEWCHWCDCCACGFNKLKRYEEHLRGKRHNANIHQAEESWITYQTLATKMKAKDCWFDPSATKEMVGRQWSLDLFMEGLPARSRSSIKKKVSMSSNRNGSSGQLDPSIRLSDLPPDKRAFLWNLLHRSTVPNFPDMIANLPPHYVRVKELLESIEVFHHIQKLLKRSRSQKYKPKLPDTIYDIACGHGMVGMLCAAAYPSIQVHAIDLVPRESFQAQRAAFYEAGVPLDNLHFRAVDFTVFKESIDNANSTITNSKEDEADNGNALLLCVHGCKSLTHESIELAEENRWAWLSVPCCLQANNHLPNKDTTLRLDDQTRFTMLCGAIAARYEPDTIAMIDNRITGRGIVLTKSKS